MCFKTEYRSVILSEQAKFHHYPLRGSLACDWTPVAAGKLELLARETYGGCWSCRKGRRQKMNETRENHRVVHERQIRGPHLCDILRWNDCVAHVPASWSWCQDSAWREVGEVGLDLG